MAGTVPTTDRAPFSPQNSNQLYAAPIDVQILVELRLHSVLLQQGFNLEDNLDTLRQEIAQSIAIVP